MTIKHVYYATGFKKALDKLASAEKDRAKNKLQLFRRDPFNPQLKTHKLSGKLQQYWSFSITYQLGILFEFIDKESVGLIDIGTHQIYRR